METESETYEKIGPEVPPLEKADSYIISNIVLQGTLFFLLMLFYFFIRPKVSWLYYPNPQGRPNHPCYGYVGRLSWLIPLFKTSDTVLLSLIGLDAFMMCQTLKLMCNIIMVLIFLFLPILSYIYWNESEKNTDLHHQYLTKLSIGNLNPNSSIYCCIPIILYLMSFIIYYLVFIYYKKYTSLRQLYLRNPSTMASIITLKKLSKTLGSAEESTKYLSLPNRTVLVSNIPSFVRTDEDLRDFFIYLGLGNIEDTIIIHDTTQLQDLYNSKNECIENIEKEVNNTLYKMNKWSKKHHEESKKSINNFKGQLFETVENETRLKDMNIEEKIKLFREFIQTDDNFKTKYAETTIAIDLYFEQLKEIYRKIKEEKESIKERYTRFEEVNIGNEIARNNSLFIPESEHNTDFFSISQILRYKENKDYLTLDLPINTRKGFVIFKDFIDANTVRSSQLGSRIFSVTAEAAPAPNDILWNNITKGVVSNQFYKIFGDIAFVIFNLTFIFMVIYVIRVLDTKRFQKDGYFMRFLNSYDILRSSYEGIVPPLVYALLLFFVPTFITILINLEGVHSHSKFQQVLMEKFLYFLFYNGFISAFLASTLISQIFESSAEKTNFLKFVTEFGNKIIESSVFFFNTIVQKSLFGTAMFLLKPGPLVVNYLLVNILPNKTRREVEQTHFCPSFNFGSCFPSVLIVFPMVLVYAILVPPILIPGFFFFLFNFYAFKNEFLYATRTEYESGGVFWQTSVKIIINSVLFFQIVTFAKLFADKRYLLLLSVAPLIWISWNFESTINKLFMKCCNLHPLNIKEEQYLDEFTYKLNQERIELLNSWQEEENDPVNNIDVVDVADLGYVDEDEISKKSYYRDPNTSSSISDFILPKGFFNLVKFLKEKDTKNIFGYKNGFSKKYKN